VLKLLSQPSPALLLQLPKPALQATWQAELTQEGVAFVVEQALPQPPQLAVSAARFSQIPLHAVWPEGHASASSGPCIR